MRKENEELKNTGVIGTGEKIFQVVALFILTLLSLAAILPFVLLMDIRSFRKNGVRSPTNICLLQIWAVFCVPTELRFLLRQLVRQLAW